MDKEIVRYVEDVDIDRLKMLLDEGVSPNTTNSDGVPLLVIAMAKGAVSMAQLLIDHGADVNNGGQNRTALHYAISHMYGYNRDEMMILLLRNGAKPTPEDLIHVITGTKYLYVVRMMVEMGVDVNSVVDNTTPLMEATYVGDIDIVLFLIEKGANVNYRNRNGITPLMNGLYNDNIAIVQILVENGADVGAVDNYGYNPLSSTIDNGYSTMVEVLLRGKGVNLEAISNTIYKCDDAHIMSLLISHGLKVDADRGGEQLLRACMRDDYDMVRLLVDNGADMNIRDDDGMTPLMVCLNRGNTDMSAYLISKGANLDVKDEYGNTALMRAIKDNSLYLVRMMIEKGANTRIRDDNGNNTLMVHMGNPSSSLYILTLLLNTGMSPDTQNVDGMTPLMRAASRRDPLFLVELLKHGANPNIRNDNGDTALIIAARNGLVENVRILLKHGAYTNIKNTKGETAYTVTYNTEIRNLISKYSSSMMSNQRGRGKYMDIASV